MFVNGYRNHFDGIRMLSEETEPDKANTRVDQPVLPDGLEASYDVTCDMSGCL